MCNVGSWCWKGDKSEDSGCKTEAAPSAKCMSHTCLMPKVQASGYCDDATGCNDATCCENPICNQDGTTAADKVCKCGWGSNAIKACAVGNYCWNNHGSNKCTANNKDSYPRQRCSDGFSGWQGNADTCPPNFGPRDLGAGSEKDDGHQGKMMDYTTCCQASCSVLYTNCDAVDSTISLLSNHRVYPPLDGTSYEQQECCRRSACKQWSNSGGTCPSDKSMRGDEDFHMCSDGGCDADECCQDNHGGGSDSGDGESQECKDAQAITDKNKQSDDSAGTYVSQCYDVSTNSEEDVTKWTFKKGTGSCAVCKDALQLYLGSTCEGAPGKDCKHCQGIIDAYKDCPTTAKTGEGKDSKTDIDSKTVSNTVTPTFSVAHTITLEGISAAEFMADSKIILSFQESIATTLKVDVDKIVNIKAKSSRRQLSGRGMAAAGCRYI